ncbi:MAG: hypothetical protein NXI31_06000 [bacterium]|nr:hypothetical protein [bacterium]
MKEALLRERVDAGEELDLEHNWLGRGVDAEVALSSSSYKKLGSRADSDARLVISSKQ